MSVIAVVRIRGRMHMKPGIAATLDNMGLTRKNYCILLSESENNKGILQKVKDYVSWGITDEKMILSLLTERGRTAGQKRLTDEYVKQNSKHKDLKSLAKSLASSEAKISDVEGMKRVFRLNPPKKGFERKGIKVPYSLGGVLGNRADKINQLLERMI